MYLFIYVWLTNMHHIKFISLCKNCVIQIDESNTLILNLGLNIFI